MSLLKTLLSKTPTSAGKTLSLWGNNNWGQIGDNTIINKSSPVQIGAADWAQISLGTSHTAAIKYDGSLWTWGYNNNGQLGISGSLTAKSSPVQIGTSSWTAVSVGDTHTLAIRNDGALFGWGSQLSGRVGIPAAAGGNVASFYTSPVNISAAVVPGVLAPNQSFISVAAGYDYSLAVKSDGVVWTWGNNINGQLGDASVISKSSPVQIGTIAGVSKVFATSGSNLPASFAIKSDGSLYAWGVNTNGRLGNNSVAALNAPALVSSSSWTSVSIGGSHAVAIRNDGALFGWGSYAGTADFPGINSYGAGAYVKSDGSLFTFGSNTDGLLGSNTSETFTTFTKIAGGGEQGLAIKPDGSLWSWGGNSNGELGQLNRVNKSSPVQIGTSSWALISSWGFYTLAIRSDGALFTWGDNTTGQLGQLDRAHRSSPIQIGTSSWTVASACDFSGTSFAIRSDGTLWGWGNNGNGQLGQLDQVHRSSPVQIGTSSWTSVSSGKYPTFTTAAIRSDGALFTWGDNTIGQLGQLDLVHRSSPVQIGTSSWTSIGSIGAVVSALRSDGALFAWGSNIQGSLGDDTNIAKSSPVQIGTSSWASVATSISFTTGAIRSDGSLFMWGYNAGYLIGDDTVISKSSPVQVRIGGQAISSVITGGSYNTLALTMNGNLFIWGANFSGQFGNNTITPNYRLKSLTPDGLGSINSARSSPVQIGTSSWSMIGGGTFQKLAIRYDGALFAWGSNATGQLGQNDTVHRSSPVQIGTSSWTMVAADVTLNSLYFSSGISTAIRSDGRLFVWGNNDSGQLGQNDIVHRSSPVQVGTSSWTSVAAGSYMTAAIRSDGGLFTWGRNTYGSIGDSTFVHRSSPVQVGTSSWTAVTAGKDFISAIRSDGALFCVGDNSSYVAGQEVYTAEKSFTQISFTEFNGCGISNTGSLWIWGNNDFGQLGQLDRVHRSSPVQIGTSSWTSVSVGRSLISAIRSDGGLFTWGRNVDGQLGDGSFLHRSSPVQVGTSSWSQVKAGIDHTVALRSDGRLFAWGGANYGQLGDNFSLQNQKYSWTSVSCGQSVTLMIRSDGSLWTTGAGNALTRMGLDEVSGIHRSSPVQIGTSSWSQVLSMSNRMAIRSDGGLFVWGTNSVGELGLNDLVHRSSPVQVGTSSWTKVGACGGNTASGSGSLAIRQDGGLFAWGPNFFGGLGLNDGITRSSPVQIGTSSWASVSGSVSNIMGAIRSDGGLFVWGLNTSGQLGDNTIVTKSSPVQIGTSSWSAVAAGTTGMAAIRSDGALFAWGNNLTGGLGQNDTINRSSPVQIGTSSWTVVSLDDASTTTTIAYAIRKDGGLFIWGNHSGSFGSQRPGLAVALSSPIQIGSSSWTMISGKAVPAAIRSDGALFTWGNNSNGQAGFYNPLTTQIQSPVLIGEINTKPYPNFYSTPVNIYAANSPISIGTSSWSAISAGESYTHAIRSDGTLWSWGINSYSLTQGGSAGGSISLDFYIGGQLGDNLSTADTSNISWSQVSVGDSFIMGITTDKLLWGWGGGATATNVYGFGDPSASLVANQYRTGRYSPAQVGTSSWNFIAHNSVGGAAVIAPTGETVYQIKSDGSLWSWGNGAMGKIGDNTVNIHRSSAIQIGTSSWSIVANAFNATAAILSDGGLFTWGDQGSGELGINGIPAAAGASSWSQVFTSIDAYNATASNTYAKKPDGTLWAWGANSYGQLGDNTNIAKSSPVQIGTSSWSVVSANAGAGALAIRSDFKLFAWGANDYGILGQLDRVHRSSPVQIGTSSWIALASSNGSNNAAAIRSDGGLFIWGRDDYGMLGQNTSSSGSTWRSSPVQVGTSSWSAIATNSNTFAAIRSDGGLFTWGYNFYGEAGVNQNTIASSYIYVAAYQASGAAIRSDGSLWTWGNNTFGQLGLGNRVHRSYPVALGDGRIYSAVKVNEMDMLAITTSGQLFSWGYNYRGELGLGIAQLLYRSAPVQIGASSWIAIASGRCQGPGGGYHGANNFAIRLDGRLYAWGYNQEGQLGDNTNQPKSSPVNIGISSWTAVCSAGDIAMAIRSDGALFTWGDGRNGPMAFGLNSSSQVHRSSPVQIGTSTWTAISGGQTSVSGQQTTEITWLAIRSDGALFAWGYGNVGQLGDNTRVTKSSPVQIGTSSWSSINAGSSNMAAIRKDGGLFTWGSSFDGEFGTNINGVYRSSPVQVGTSSWSMITSTVRGMVANATIFGIRSDKMMFVWGGSGTATSPSVNSASDWLGAVSSAWRSSPVQVGSGPQGRLGVAVDLHYSSPVQVGTSSWSALATGFSRFLAKKSDGTLWTWGNNFNGALGINDTVSRSSPVQIGTSSWTAIAASYYNGWGIIGNTLYGWGQNTYSQIGLPSVSVIDQSSPVQIGAGTSWSSVAGGTTGAAAISTNSALYIWGNNTFGQIGDNTTTNLTAGVAKPFDASNFSSTTSRLVQVSPVQLGTSSWTTISTNNTERFFAIRQDGGLFAWGSNTSGQLGQNDTVHRSSPVQVGTSSWLAVASAYGQTTVSNAAIFAVRSDGALFAWGDNTAGQLGQLDRVHRSSPVQIGTSSWTKVGGGYQVGYAITLDNKLFGWGNNANGQLGQLDIAHRSSPVQIGTSSWTAVTSSGFTAPITAAIRSDGALFMWGNNTNNVIPGVNTANGYAGGGHRSSPVLIGLRGPWPHRPELLGNTIGDSNFRGVPLTVHSPIQIGTSSWTSISAGKHTTAAVRSDGGVFAWGNNAFGQLGQLDLVHRSSPVQIGTSSWTAVAENAHVTLAIRSDGGLFTWGNNGAGELGASTIAHRSSPVQVGTSSWSAIAAGSIFNGTGAFTTVGAGISNNVLYAWGYNTNSAIGNNSAINRSSPVLIGAGTYINSPVQVGTSSWASISAGASNMFAIRSDLVLFTWGANPYGQLSSNSTAHRSSPVQVAAGLWASIVAGSDTGSVYGYQLSGSGQIVYAWGRNDLGQLGLNLSAHRSSPVQVTAGLPTSRSSPVQIGSLSWSAIAAGLSNNTLAINSSNKLYVWGDNSSASYKIVPNSIVPVYGSPVQIGSNNYTAAAIGNLHLGILST